MSEVKTQISNLVEQRLLDAQKNKTFKDAGRIGGTRKASVAYTIISTQNLADLEQDQALAYKKVVKKNVWPPIDVEAEKQAGQSSGCVYLKVQYQRALANQPLNSPQNRKIYIEAITAFRALLDACNNAKEAIDTADQFWRLENLKLVVPDLLDGLRTGYAQNSDAEKRAISIFSKTFLNLTRGHYSSDAAREKINAALLFDAFTAEQAQPHIERFAENKQKNIERLEAEKAKTEALPFKEKLAWFKTNFYGQQSYNPTPEQLTERLFRYYTTKIAQAKSAELNKLYRERQADWSWAVKEEKAATTTDKTSEEAEKPRINKPPFLSHIKRTNGLKVPEITSSEGVKNLWGLSAVQYGNSLKDSESATLARFLNAAFMDLEEATGLDLVKLHNYGNLGVDFATRGTSGSAATYWSTYRVINLNKRNGDGSLNHEWGHFLDNMLSVPGRPETDVKLNGQPGTFATETQAKNPLIDGIIKEWKHFVKNGDGTQIAQITVTPKNHGYRVTKKGETFEETLDYYKFYRRDRKWNLIVENIAFLYGEQPITYAEKINKSLLLYHSEQMNTGKSASYWSSQVEMFARSWEKYVLRKLQQKGIQNTFLQPPTKWAQAWGVYPEGHELDVIESIFDRLVAAIKTEYQAESIRPLTGERVNLEVANPFIESDTPKTEKAEKTEPKPKIETPELKTASIEPQSIEEFIKATKASISSKYNYVGKQHRRIEVKTYHVYVDKRTNKPFKPKTEEDHKSAAAFNGSTSDNVKRKAWEYMQTHKSTVKSPEPKTAQVVTQGDLDGMKKELARLIENKRYLKFKYKANRKGSKADDQREAEIYRLTKKIELAEKNHLPTPPANPKKRLEALKIAYDLVPSPGILTRIKALEIVIELAA